MSTVLLPEQLMIPVSFSPQTGEEKSMEVHVVPAHLTWSPGDNDSESDSTSAMLFEDSDNDEMSISVPQVLAADRDQLPTDGCKH